MPCSCAATKPCPLAASPRSWTNCANPASKMSAWLPSPSARARAPDEMTYDLNHTAGPNLKVPLVFSLAFHSLLFGSLIVSTLLSHRGETWGVPGHADPRIHAQQTAALRHPAVAGAGEFLSAAHQRSPLRPRRYAFAALYAVHPGWRDPGRHGLFRTGR